MSYEDAEADLQSGKDDRLAWYDIATLTTISDLLRHAHLAGGYFVAVGWHRLVLLL